MIPTIKLSNGIEMPQVGYGVYQVTPEECERCVLDAIEVGYRMIDTAQAYHNEAQVGNAIAKSGVKREDLFLVTKMWMSNRFETLRKKHVLSHLQFKIVPFWGGFGSKYTKDFPTYRTIS